MGLLESINSQKGEGPHVVNIEVKNIVPDPNQPRKRFEGLEDLATTIQEHGLQNPIHVLQNGGKYIIITGERRWRSCKEHTDLKVLPCIIHDKSDMGKIKYLQLIENLQREGLGLLEEAQAYQNILSDGRKQVELSAEIGVSVTEINKSLKLLKLAGKIQDDLAKYPDVPKSLLIEIAGEEEEKQLELWAAYQSGEVTKREDIRAKKITGKKKNEIADKEAEEIWRTVRKAVKKDPSVAAKVINPAKLTLLPPEVLWPVIAVVIKKDKSLAKELLDKSEVKKLLGKKEK